MKWFYQTKRQSPSKLRGIGPKGNKEESSLPPIFPPFSFKILTKKIYMNYVFKANSEGIFDIGHGGVTLAGGLP